MQSSLSDPLDLSYFSCQEVNLSLAVVNIHGSSQFTPPTQLCVHGGMSSYNIPVVTLIHFAHNFVSLLGPPGAPNNLRSVSVVDDPRPGFPGHAVVTLEWDIPEEGI